MTDKILGFQNEYRFLSNFVPVKVQLDDVWYPSVEHAYQAAKTLNKKERVAIQEAPGAAQSKRLAQKLTLRKDWLEAKDVVMRDLLIQKFTQEPYKEQLLATGDAYLEETNIWNDTYWGVCRGKGQNKLGVILMEIREALKIGE
jgi:ribA/ribD-fused uncharacterized protein